MENNENQKNVNEIQPKKTNIRRILSILQYVAVAMIIIGVLYLGLNPQELKNGKKLAKEGDYEGAVSEFQTGLYNYYNDELPGGRKVRFLVSFGYRMNLHNFYYNMALSFEALGKMAESKNDIKNTLVYYAYAIEAYDSTILEKENHKKSIEAIEIVEAKFIDILGEPYVMGTIFETDAETKATAATGSLLESDVELIVEKLLIAAKLLSEEGQYEEALFQYDKALAYYPNSIEIYELKLETLYKLEDYDKAKDCIKSIFELDQDNETAKKYQGMMI